MLAKAGGSDTQPIGRPRATDPAPAPTPDPSTSKSADGLSRTAQWRQAYVDERHRIAAMVGAVASAEARKNGQYEPPSVNQSPVSGGAPALGEHQMSPSVVNSSPLLKFLYSGAVQSRAPWLLDVYQVATRVTGPIGAFVNVGFNVWNAKKIFSDPKTPTFIKAGIAGSTALAGVSAAAATRLSLAAFKILPLADGAMKGLSQVAGVAGLGAGTVLAGINTYNTFKNPKSTDAAKGFSVVTTAGSLALTIVTVASIGGPVGTAVGIGLAAITVGSMFAQSFLAHNKVANEVFGAIGRGVAGGANALAHVAGSIGHGISSVAGDVGGAVSHFFSGL